MAMRVRAACFTLCRDLELLGAWWGIAGGRRCRPTAVVHMALDSERDPLLIAFAALLWPMHGFAMQRIRLWDLGRRAIRRAVD